MRIYKLAANITATIANAASVVMAKTGRIKRISWSIDMDSVVDNESARIELSFVPVSFVGVNDSAGPVAQAGIRNNGTSGGQFTNEKVEDVDIPVALGEHLYLNAVVTGTPTAVNATCFVHVED